jgi:hypothetical protein
MPALLNKGHELKAARLNSVDLLHQAEPALVIGAGGFPRLCTSAERVRDPVGAAV